MWRARLAAFGLRAPSPRPAFAAPRKLFSHVSPSDLLAQAGTGDNSRERLYSLRGTFWGFLWQTLHPATSCREVVRQIQALFCGAGLSTTVDEGTSAYCQARKRLPLPVLQRARAAAAQHAEALLEDRQGLGGAGGQGHRWLHLEPGRHPRQPASLPPTGQPEARLRLSPAQNRRRL